MYPPVSLLMAYKERYNLWMNRASLDPELAQPYLTCTHLKKLKVFISWRWGYRQILRSAFVYLHGTKTNYLTCDKQHGTRSSHPEVILGKRVLKTCSKFTGEHPCRSAKSHLKSHFGMGVLLWICCIFLEHLFLGTPLDGCFWWYCGWMDIW